jgi:hypothetical protein
MAKEKLKQITPKLNNSTNPKQNQNKTSLPGQETVNKGGTEQNSSA